MKIKGLIAFLLLLMVALVGCGKSGDQQAQGGSSTDQTDAKPKFSATAPAGTKTVTTASGLKYEDVKVGDGQTVKVGDHVMVDYVGWLTNGKEFDSNYKGKGTPFDFTVGQSMVIPGWDEGVQGMKVGGKRRLTIPPDLAYGPDGAEPVIPPDSTLIFEIHVLGIAQQ